VLYALQTPKKVSIIVLKATNKTMYFIGLKKINNALKSPEIKLAIFTKLKFG